MTTAKITNATRVPCPYCGVPANAICVSAKTSGNPTAAMHSDRITLMEFHNSLTEPEGL